MQTHTKKPGIKGGSEPPSALVRDAHEGRPSAWIAIIPDVLNELKVDGAAWFSRRDIEALLAVKARRAQEILSVAGAARNGNTFLVSRQNLVVYLENVGREVIAEEQKRKARFAARLTGLRTQFIERPKVLVELKTSEAVKLQREGLKALPDGISLRPGSITVSGFEVGDDALELLMKLALAIATDRAEFDRVVALRKAAS